jgi:large subunit ribosomal protein L15
MSNLSTIGPVPGSQTRRTRVARGRGTGIGGTSGRGMNGQNSRTGKGKRYPTFEGGQTRLFMRTPKKRGFTAYKPEQFVVVNLDTLQALADAGVMTSAVSSERRIRLSRSSDVVSSQQRSKSLQILHLQVRRLLSRRQEEASLFLNNHISYHP